ncbi:MAG: hypothetical protein QXS85_00090 [Acidilobaceae archaeon]
MLDTETLSELISTYGIVGLFIAVFICNLIPVTGLSFTISVGFFTLASVSSPLSLKILLAPFVIATAATLAKVLIFGTSRSVSQRFYMVRKRRKDIARLLKGKEHIVMIITAIVASTPLPDDVWNILMGAIGFNSRLFVLSIFAGKLFQATLAMLIGTFLGSSFTRIVVNPEILSGSSMWGILLSATLTLSLAVLITYSCLKIDWVRFTTVYARRGLWEALRDAFSQVFSK